MKDRYKKAHMEATFVYANLSHCKRRKVGCLIVKDDNIIAFGFNGTPAGEDNECEDEHGMTKPNVRHAEINAIEKLERRGGTTNGASLFVTKVPCKSCAERIYKAGITNVYFTQTSTTNQTQGEDFLKAHGINVERIITSELHLQKGDKNEKTTTHNTIRRFVSGRGLDDDV